MTARECEVCQEHGGLNVKLTEIHTDVKWIKKFWWMALLPPTAVICAAFVMWPSITALNERVAKINDRVATIEARIVYLKPETPRHE